MELQSKPNSNPDNQLKSNIDISQINFNMLHGSLKKLLNQIYYCFTTLIKCHGIISLQQRDAGIDIL